MIGQRESPGQPGREVNFNSLQWFALAKHRVHLIGRDTKGMERQSGGPCGDFEEIEIKAFSLSSFAFLPRKWFPGWAHECWSQN